MTDRTMKTFLLAIALGLWANALQPLIAPGTVRAQDFSNLESILRSIDSKLGYIESDVDSMETHVGRIARGTCSGAICESK